MWKGSGTKGEWTPSYETDDAVVYVLDRNFRLTHCNLAWDRFALNNGGARATRERQLGRNVLDAMSSELAGFCRKKYCEVLETHREHTNVTECSSPRLRRRFQMSIRACGDAGAF